MSKTNQPSRQQGGSEKPKRGSKPSHNQADNLDMAMLKVMIAEIEAVVNSLVWPMQGYEQEVLGEKRFVCRICGHCPSALLERLKQIVQANDLFVSSPDTKSRKAKAQ